MPGQVQTVPRTRLHQPAQRGPTARAVSPTQTRGLTGPELPPGETRVSTPSLSLMLPPTLGCDLAPLQRQFIIARTQTELCKAVRTRLACWFSHMIALDFVTSRELIDALDVTTSPFSVAELFRSTSGRLSKHLNALIVQHGDRLDEPYAEGIYLSSNPWDDRDGEYNDPYVLTVTMEGYLSFDVDTLHRLPADFAALAYEALSLIDHTLVACLLPGTTWDGSVLPWGSEDMRDEYRTLIDAGALTGQLEAARQRAEKEGFSYFGGESEDFHHQLVRAQDIIEGRPTWMKDCKPSDLSRRLSRLKRLAAQPPKTAEGRSWGEFIRYTCSVISTRFESQTAHLRYEEAQREHCVTDLSDGDVPLHLGLWVDSGSDAERYNCEELFQMMSDSGERPVEMYDLQSISSDLLLQILENISIGVGLLIRATTVNAQLRRRVS